MHDDRIAECPMCGVTDWYAFYKSTEVQRVSTGDGSVHYDGVADRFDSDPNYRYECSQCGFGVNIDPPSDEYEDLLAAIAAHPLSKRDNGYEANLRASGVL